MTKRLNSSRPKRAEHTRRGVPTLSPRHHAVTVATLKQSAQTVQRALDEAGVGCIVEELPASTRSAAEAAAAIGCDVQQIAKTIVFRIGRRDTAVVVIACGSNQIDENAVAAQLGAPIERATPEFVREQTGFAIGGVPPCGYRQPPAVLIDEELMPLAEIWAAAGTPNAVFRLTPVDLLAVSGGQVARVAQAG